MALSLALKNADSDGGYWLKYSKKLFATLSFISTTRKYILDIITADQPCRIAECL